MKSLRWLLCTCFILVSAPAFAEESDFSRLAKLIEFHYQVQREHIPFLGMIKPMFNAARPLGAKGMEMAVFEDLPPGRADVTQELGRLTQAALGPNWQPTVRVFSRANREQNLIYSRTNGKNFRLMILSLDSNGVVLLEVEFKPAQLAKWLRDPEHVGKCVTDKREDDWEE